MSASKLTPFAVAACATILSATATAKVFAILTGAAILDIQHPVFAVSYRWVFVSVALAECLIMLTIATPRRFLLSCAALGQGFLTYHFLTALFGIKGPCGCLGGLMGKQFAEYETAVSVLMAAALVILPFVTFVPRGEVKQMPSNGHWWVTAATVATFSACSGLVLAALSERVIWGDEGVEAWKAMLYQSRTVGPDVWNDQPPLFSKLVSHLLPPGGDSAIHIGRIACAITGAVFAAALTVSLGATGHAWSAPIAVLLIWATSWRYIAPFQLEFPAYAMAVSALAPVSLSRSGRAFAASVAIAVLALNIKLTAAVGLVIPGVFLALRSWPRVIAWSSCVVGGLIVSSLVQPDWNWRTMWVSHTATDHQLAGVALTPRMVLSAWPLILLAMLATGKGYNQGTLKPLTPWIAGLLTALAIHATHTPFWDYYSIHFMVPLAVLAGVGVIEVLKASNSDSIGIRAATLMSLCGLAFWTITVIHPPYKAVKTGERITQACPVVNAITKWQPKSEPMFASRPSFAVAAGRLPFPHLTVLARKRFAAKELAPDDIVNTILGAESSTFVIDEDFLDRPEWAKLIRRYSVGANSHGALLMVRKDLLPQDLPYTTRGDRLRSMGL